MDELNQLTQLSQMIDLVADNSGTDRETVITTAIRLLQLESAVDRMYTIEELCNEWRCSYQFVYRLIKDGRLKAVKIGKAWKIRYSDKVSAEKKLIWGDRIRRRR